MCRQKEIEIVNEIKFDTEWRHNVDISAQCA